MDIPKKRPAKIGMWSIENSAGFYVRWWSQLVHRKQRNDRVWKTGRCALWKTTSSQGYQDISRISMDISQPWFKSHQSEKKIVQCVSLRLFELCLSLVGHLQHEVHCPLVGGTHGFMEFHGNAGGVPKWSYPKSLYVIGFNTKSWSSITWSGGTPSAWGDRDMRSCRGQNLKKTS